MGFKVFGGVALFRDPPLPVPLDALFMAHVLVVGELIKMLFEWCRYLLPVWSYGGLNFLKAVEFGGIKRELRFTLILVFYTRRKPIEVTRKPGGKIKNICPDFRTMWP